MNPMLVGSLRLVSAQAALALGIKPLTDLAYAGPDWELDIPSAAMSGHGGPYVHHEGTIHFLV